MMSSLSLMITLIAIYTLYHAAFRQQQAELRKLASSQAALLKASIELECPNRHCELPSSQEKIITILKRTYQMTRGLKPAEQFVLAKTEGAETILLLNYPNIEQKRLDSENSFLKEPLKRALAGQSGSLIIKNAEQTDTLIIYEPINRFNLNWGLVIKINLRDLQEPFIQAGYYTLGITLLVNLVGVLVFLKISGPVIKQMEVYEEVERSIFENTPEGRITYNPENQIEAVNNQAAIMFQYSREEIIGKPVSFLIPNFTETTEGLWGRKSNGDRFPLAVTISSVTDSLQTINTLNLKDISYLQKKNAKSYFQQNAQIKTVFESTAIGIVVVDKEGKIIRVNPATEKIFGYWEDELEGKNFRELIHAEDLAITANSFSKLINKEIEYYQHEKRYIRKDGEIIWGKVKVSLSTDAADSPQYVIGMIEDISEKKRQELAMSELMRRHQLLIRALGEITYEHNVPKDHIHWQGDYQQYLGYSPEEVGADGNSWLTKVHPDDLPEVLEEFDQAFVRDKMFNLEYRLRCYDGSDRWFHDRGVMYGEVNGQPELVIGVLRDITTGKSAEAELRATKNQLEAIVENITDGIGMLNAQGKLIYVNQSLARMSGYTFPQEMLARSRADSLLDDYELFDELNQPLPTELLPSRLVFQGISPKPTVIGYIIKKTGRQYWSIVYATPVFDDQEQIEFVVTVAHDITEAKQVEIALRESKERFQELVENIHQVFWIISPDLSQMIYISPSVQEVFGLSCEHLYENALCWLEVLHPDDRKSVEQALEVMKKQGIYAEQYRIIHSDGSVRWIFSRCSAIRAENGEILRYVGIGEDITKQKLAAQALQEANTKLTQWVNYLEAQNRDLALLEQLNDFLQSCNTLEEAYNTLGDLLSPLFANCSGGVFINDSVSHLMKLVSSWGKSFDSKIVFSSYECWALRRGRFHQGDLTQPSLLCSHIDHHHLPVQSLCIPMMAQGKTIGLLYLSGSKVEINHCYKLARMVSEQIAMALANLELREELRNQSIRDPLTGLFNRRYLQESLVREIHNARRKEYPIGIVMVDVDHFKSFNDTYGHELGDQILCQLGAFLKQNTRGSDIACRYGGEEFLLILPDSSLKDSLQRAESFRQGIEKLYVKNQNQEIKITVSLGVAALPESGQTMEKLIHAADVALYRAKQAGRNRVMAAN